MKCWHVDSAVIREIKKILPANTFIGGPKIIAFRKAMHLLPEEGIFSGFWDKGNASCYIYPHDLILVNLYELDEFCKESGYKTKNEKLHAYLYFLIREFILRWKIMKKKINIGLFMGNMWYRNNIELDSANEAILFLARRGYIEPEVFC